MNIINTKTKLNKDDPNFIDKLSIDRFMKGFSIPYAFKGDTHVAQQMSDGLIKVTSDHLLLVELWFAVFYLSTL